VIRLEPLSPLSPSKSVFRNVVVTAAVIQWLWSTCSIIGILVVWILAQSHIETLHARRADCNNLLSGSGILRASQYMCYSKSFSGDVRMDTAVMVQGALMTTNKHRVRTTIFKKKNRVKGVSKLNTADFKPTILIGPHLHQPHAINTNSKRAEGKKIQLRCQSASSVAILSAHFILRTAKPMTRLSAKA
jgi:hypothetical protein